MNHLEFARAWLHVHLRSDRGASLVEYALLVALIALACFAAIEGLGGKVSDSYSEIGSSFQTM